MSHKTILVILDGLNQATAEHAMGFLNALCEAGRGQRYALSCELPAISRPLYECLLTGDRPIDSGIVNNGVVRRSRGTSLFDLVRAAGGVTAAAAYHWMSELYNRAPFDALCDRAVDDEALMIQHGRFYWCDHYPDDHLFCDAELLRRRYAPDFLLIHSMNIDDTGHRFGGDSPQYRNSARSADLVLSNYLPGWLEAGDQVMITADHGMNADGTHLGTLPEERRVPLWTFGEGFSRAPVEAIEQTALCGTLATLMGLDHDKACHPGLLKTPAHRALSA